MAHEYDENFDSLTKEMDERYRDSMRAQVSEMLSCIKVMQERATLLAQELAEDDPSDECVSPLSGDIEGMHKVLGGLLLAFDTAHSGWLG